MRNTQKILFDPAYPSIDSLQEAARRRIPPFVFDYLEGGCNREVNLRRNREDLQDVKLTPNYLAVFKGAQLQTKLFGQQYSAPFGVAPIGLQGMIWPNAPEILARACFQHNLPYILSTVSTSSIERISELTEGSAWFQFYHPADPLIRDNMLDRVEAAGCKVLVLLCDTPTFGYRPKEIRNGLSMPPRMTLNNILQMVSKPPWLFGTLRTGLPQFANLKAYMPAGLNLHQLGNFMDSFFEKRMNPEKIAYIRDRWKGKLLIKGVSTVEDAAVAVELGLDGIIVSNHGGRQLDAGPSSIEAFERIASEYEGKISLMMDSGVRTGPDVARCLAKGAAFTFLGRSFMYGVGALGNRGGEHTISLLKTQLRQIMEQIGCEKVEDLPGFLWR
ncbi:alpha-hydroxy acid oxidase [Robiginitalea sp. IMCC43444]|uniref:alpha-hydroxy acid oxidase n=1 Tax=Robiginitalea sp. IMCC43444 TaxID=3459121 RepID=UPI004043222F